MLARSPGGIPFYLICSIVALVIAAMAANEWRRLQMSDYLRVAAAAGVVFVGRLAGALLLPGLAGGSACLEWALEGLTVAAFVGAFLYNAFPAPQHAVLFFTLSAAPIAGLLTWCALLPGPGLPRSLEIAWPVLLLLLGGFGLFQWARQRRIFSIWLGCAFAILMLAPVGGLAGRLELAVLGHLAALPLFAIETYRTILADFAAFGYELQDISEQTLRQTREMAFLLEVTRAIVASLDLPVVLERVSEAVARAMNADWAYILLPAEGDAGSLAVAAHYGWWGRRRKEDGQPASQVTLRYADLPGLQHAIQTGHQVLANRPEEYESFRPLHDMQGRGQSGPTLVQPILLQERALGLVVLGHVGDQAAFSEEDAKLCQALVGQVATAIDNARLYQSVDEHGHRLTELLRVREEEATQRRAILESIADGVVVAGGNGEVVLANAAAERILGLSSEQLLGQTIKRLYAGLLRARGRGRGAQAVFEWDDKVVRGSLAPVKMPDGTLLGYVAVFRDVTRERQAEQAKSKFVASVSHELRTPMTSIKGYIELIATGAVGAVTQQQRHFLEIVHNNTERMIGLVNNLIAVSEMERGLVHIEPRPVDMAKVIEEAVQAVRSKAEERRMKLNLKLPPTLSPAKGDPQRLRQIMDNLLDNAVRYTPPEGCIDVWAADVRLEDQSVSPQQYVVVNVRDTGVGIALEEQDRIFEKFYRADNPLSHEAGGTGMGLAIVKMLVEAHGGRIWVDSWPGKGSTFSFVVPTANSGRR